MEYAVLGKTGRTVSRLGFGGATAGLTNYTGAYDPDRAQDRERVIGTIQRAVELGVTYFDTAAGYGNGKSEEIFGEALENADKDVIFLATKAGIWSDPSPSTVRTSLDQSLKRLRRDSVDLLQIHGAVYSDGQVDAILKPGGIADELDKMKEEGLIKAAGFTSEGHNSALFRLIESGRFDVMQMLYNLQFQHPYDPVRQSGSLFDAEAQEMGIVTMRAATAGIFQKWIRAVNPDNDFDYTSALIQFPFSNPLVDVVLVGMRETEILEKNVALVDDVSGRVDIAELHNRYV